jgi:hypothetical protein
LGIKKIEKCAERRLGYQQSAINSVATINVTFELIKLASIAIR